MPKSELSGKIFGRLLVMKESGHTKCGKVKWLCRCSCGRKTTVNSGHLKSGHTRSCGCLSIETTTTRNTKHGNRYIPEYTIWRDMHRRCSNIKAKGFEYYGGRGIVVCESWSSFDNFYRDMGSRPGDDLSLERINNDGPYSPYNCKWATRTEQSNNTSRNRIVTFNGKKQTMAQLARHLEMNYSRLRYLVKKSNTRNELIL